ncbi:MAG TPA: energy transducer TonB [Terriglobales bacterium]|nr:energy transducer TonB [Terriglobales bacterium]
MPRGFLPPSLVDAKTFCGAIQSPIYPPEAKKQGIQGAVHLRAVIGKDGFIKDLRVIDGHPMLTGSAMDAVKDWKHKPYLVKGKPLEVETTITVNYVLDTR